MPHIRTFLLLVTVYSSVFSGASSMLVRRPLNTAVIQGSAVRLQCSSDVSNSFIPWYNSLCVTTAEQAGSCRDDLIYSGHTGSSVPRGFSVTEVNNATHVTRDLNISPTQLTDAGVYLCAERRRGDSGILDSSSAILVVLDGNMRCTTNLSASGAVQENDVIMMTCSITYSGNWAPVMRWFNSVTRHNFTDNITSTKSSTNILVSSQLTVAASADLQGSQIVCVTYFTQPSASLPTTATNIPNYTDMWASPTLNVHYAPRNLQITPRQSTYQPGDRIQCSAEGNPEPSYQWTDLISGDVRQGAVLVISKVMTNMSHAFQCTASNQYNSISSTLRFTVEAYSSSPIDVVDSNDAYKSATIALAVIAGIAIVIIVLLILYIVCRMMPANASQHHRHKGRQSSNSAAATETTNPGSSDAAYQELQMTSRGEPVYKELARQ